MRRVGLGVDRIVDPVVRRRTQRWFARHMSGRAAEYAPVEKLAR